jgi:hypothetical protein
MIMRVQFKHVTEKICIWGALLKSQPEYWLLSIMFSVTFVGSS